MLKQLVFWVNNLTPSNTNTKYTIFKPAHCVYLINTSIYLTLFRSPFLSRAYPSLFINITFCFWKRFFLFISFYWLFWLQCWFFLFRFNLIFVSFGFIFLDLWWTSGSFRFFPLWKRGNEKELTNRTFNENSTLICIFSSSPVLTINNIKRI